METDRVPRIPLSHRDYDRETIEQHVREIRDFVKNCSITDTEFSDA